VALLQKRFSNLYIMINPLTDKPYLYVAYPSPDSYYVVPDVWTVENIKVIDGIIYHNGEKTSITVHDYLSRGQMLGIVDDPELITLICNEYTGEELKDLENPPANRLEGAHTQCLVEPFIV
jgi:hypothetical protein